MSKVYEALKKAERERKKKMTHPELSPNKPVYKEGIETKDKREDKKRVKDQERAEWTESSKIKKREIIDKKVSDLLVTLKDPSSQSADQFMKVCARMLQQRQRGKRIVLIASSLPQEGKTMVAANVGIGLARLPNTNVTLIDADFRKPDLHKILGISIDKGLREYMEDGADISEIYYHTSIPHFFFIPGGKSHPQPDEILSSDKVKRLIDELQVEHPEGYIIIDTSPMLLSAEPEILLDYVDSVIMVVRYGKTQSDSLQRALHSLDKKKVLGIIFNKVDLTFLSNKHGYYKYPYYNSRKAMRRS